MTYVKTVEGRVVSGEKEIHNMVTAHFNEWFAMPKYAKASSLHISESWHDAVGSVEAFVADWCTRVFTAANIPGDERGNV